MGKRFKYEEQDNGYFFVFDTLTNKYWNVALIVNLLNEQDEKIKKLEHSQNQKAIEVLGKLRACANRQANAKANSRHSDEFIEGYGACIGDIIDFIDNKIAELRGKE